uniref:ATP dependent Clp protease n=1 Tax=Siphoviridae sp. ctpbb7 TaxID=2826465 RepID=A0A8S5N0H0_9CAUD|nr:MAG TPA: Putative ATP dependent Clp protease [Siphoviridae sp. ctpbb7]
MKRKTYYQVAENAETRTADINIYGDITSNAQVIRAFWGDDGSRSAMDIKQAIDDLDVDTINVYINSYGGEVAEALAIYSSLQRHKAQIHTYCDGFACSAATIIFCAGDVRTMGSIALMMIHNCMSYLGYANSEEMRKAAEDNDKINQSSIEAYKKVSSLSEDEIKDMMTAETWLTAQECLNYGFATEIADNEEEDDETQQTAFASIRSAILAEDKEAGIMSKLDAIQQELKELKTKEQTLPQKAEKTPQPTEKNNYLKTFFGAL